MCKIRIWRGDFYEFAANAAGRRHHWITNLEHGSVPARARGKSGRFRVVSEGVGHAARDGMRRKAKRALRKFDRRKEGWGKYAGATSPVLSVCLGHGVRNCRTLWVEIASGCNAAAVCFAEQLRGATQLNSDQISYGLGIPISLALNSQSRF